MNKLIAHGCSFTYGEELQDRTNSWPSLLAKGLGLSCTNLGTPGYSNDAVVHDLLNTNLDNSIVVVCWTSYLRMQHADYNGTFTTRPGQPILSATDTNHRNVFRNASWILDDTWLYSRWLTQVVLLQSYLKTNDIPYVFFNGFDNQHQFERYKDNFTKLASQIDIKNFPGWPYDGFVEWSYGSPIGTNGHPLEEGHKKVAEILQNHINMVWN